MAHPSNSALQNIPTHWHEPALPAFAALFEEAVRRCSAQHGLPVTPGDEMRLWAWRLCWLALDAASAPANNLPDMADAQAWTPELVELLRATPLLPKLNTQTWQELRRARDQQLFATLPLQAAPAQSSGDESLSAVLTEGFARLDLGQLRAWVTPSRTALMTQWLSACLLAIDSLALSDDNSDVSALELVLFVLATFQRLQGNVVTAEDAVQLEPLQATALSERLVPEAARGEDAPAVAAQSPTADVAAPQPAALPVPQPAAAMEQPASTSEEEPVAVRPSGLRPRTIGQLAIAAGLAAAVLLFLLKPSDVAPAPEAKQPASPVAPKVAELAPPAPPASEPTDKLQPTIKQPTGAATQQRPRFRNVAAAKRAHAAKKIDDDAYAASIAELEALRTTKIAKEQLEFSRGKLSQREYDRRVADINKKLGFDRR